MADKKLSALTELAAVPAADDEFYLRDISESATNESKKILYANLSVVRSTVVEEVRAGASASGDVSYSGAGFTPTAVLIVAHADDYRSLSWGHGDDAAGQAVVHLYEIGGTPESNSNLTNIIEVTDDAGSTYQKALLKSLDADGITLTWTKGGAGAGSVFSILYLR
jgi:hypothetical protein